MKLLLDTCSFLWYLSGDERLPPEHVREIQAASSEVWLSCVSMWEIIVKHRLGRLPLPEPPAEYIPLQRQRHAIASLVLEEAAVSHLGRLPDHHRDPFDRMLVCQAIQHDLEILTPDRQIRSYPVKTRW